MVWLITGGSGQLGRALQECLTRKDVPHATPDRTELDIAQEIDMKKLERWMPSVIINCAAWTDVEMAERKLIDVHTINCKGAEKLAVAAKEMQIPFVQISTDYVFSGEQADPWQEDDETSPQSNYGKTKLEGEKAVLDSYPEGSYVIRTAWLYSPWRRNFAKTILMRALQDLPSKVVIDQIGQPTSALDLARQIHLLLTARARFGIYHGTNSGSASWLDFAGEIYRLAGKSMELVSPISSSELKSIVNRPKYSVLGHKNWQKTNLSEMRSWQSALASVFPRIMIEAERELVNGGT